MAKKRFTIGDIQRMVANPIYAGLGPYPALVPESQWLEVAQKASGEVGVRPYLYTLREELAKALKFTEQSLPGWMAAKDWLDEAELAGLHISY